MTSQTDGEALRMLYEVTTADLTYFKTQQWSVTYYAFLINAGLIGVAQLLGAGLRTSDRAALAVLAGIAAAATLIILSKLQKSVAVRQSRLEHLRPKLGSTFERAWSAEHKGTEYVHSIYLLVGGVVVTTALTLWLLLFRLASA